MPALFILFGILLGLIFKDIFHIKYQEVYTTPVVIWYIFFILLYSIIPYGTLKDSENKTLKLFITNKFRLFFVYCFWPVTIPVITVLNCISKLKDKYNLLDKYTNTGA